MAKAADEQERFENQLRMGRVLDRLWTDAGWDHDNPPAGFAGEEVDTWSATITVRWKGMPAGPVLDLFASPPPGIEVALVTAAYSQAELEAVLNSFVDSSGDLLPVLAKYGVNRFSANDDFSRVDISYLDPRVEEGGTVPPWELASLRADLIDVLKTLTQMPFTSSEEPGAVAG
jgi:hypothetical protein